MTEDRVVSMFLPHGASYLQIMTRESQRLELRGLGWFDKPADFESIKVEVSTPPTSKDFEPAVDKVKASQCKDEMAAIVLAAVGVKLDKRGELETVREKALSAIIGD